MKHTAIVFAALILAALAAIIIYVAAGKPQLGTSPARTITPTEKPAGQGVSATPAPADASVGSTAPDMSLVDELKAGGNSYSDAAGTYVFLYPSDYKIDTQGQARIYKTGPTQKGQTEMYDGIIVTFEPITLNGKSLSEWVDMRIKESTSDGTSEVVEPKQRITVNTYPGFKFTIRGLGTYTYTVLQKDASSPNAVGITTLVSDPQQVGFQKQADAIMATIQLLK